MIKDIDSDELTTFMQNLKQKTEKEIKKKEKLAASNIKKIIRRNLWDFPATDKYINKYSLPVLRRRLEHLPLPTKKALEKAIGQSG